MSNQVKLSSETEEQIIVVNYCDMMGIPVVHIPNEGKRSPIYAGILRKMGLRKGFPDLIVFRARGGYHGLAIEMKYDDGTVKPEQKQWLKTLSKEGYACAVCWSADEAIKIIERYNACTPTPTGIEKPDA